MTAQICETLIVDGRRQQMAFCPPLPPDPRHLITEVHHEYNTETCGGATRHSCIATWTDALGAQKTEQESPFIFSSACWRRYLGTWAIIDGQFYLVRLDGKVRLAQVQPLLADWFTGVLRVPVGDRLVYVHMGFGSVYAKELHIMIERGKVMGRRTYHNEKREFDARELALANTPGGENRFPGDRDFH
jgi:hypothetical protein